VRGCSQEVTTTLSPKLVVSSPPPPRWFCVFVLVFGFLIVSGLWSSVGLPFVLSPPPVSTLVCSQIRGSWSLPRRNCRTHRVSDPVAPVPPSIWALFVVSFVHFGSIFCFVSWWFFLSSLCCYGFVVGLFSLCLYDGRWFFVLFVWFWWDQQGCFCCVLMLLTYFGVLVGSRVLFFLFVFLVV